MPITTKTVFVTEDRTEFATLLLAQRHELACRVTNEFGSVDKHAVRLAIRRALDAGWTIIPPGAKPVTDWIPQWIPWLGGNRPVPGDTPVEVRLRDGSEHAEDLAREWIWAHNGWNSDIVAYRVLSTPGVVTDAVGC